MLLAKGGKAGGGVILAGDVGGTKTNLACFAVQDETLTPVVERSVPSANYSSLETILQELMKDHTLNFTGACFGVAGPVVDGRLQATNLPWIVDVKALQRTLKLETVGLINDLEATAYGIEILPEKAFVTLHTGQPSPHGNRAVIAAGTGLGEGMLLWEGQRFRAIASEGGHADFAPRNPLEIELFRFLLGRFGRVSYERVLSGPGLVNIYRFLKETGRGEEPAWLTEQLTSDDPAAVISENALAGRSDLCVKSLDLFVSIYGAEAGNLALKVMASGGVYVGGGIAPKVLQKLKGGTFMKAFTDKGRLSPFLSQIHVRVILEERAALYGAAHYGLSLAAGSKQVARQP